VKVHSQQRALLHLR